MPLHLAHAHLGFACNRGRAPELLALIDAALADGVDITLDTYPYTAGATYLHALLPGWAHAGGPDATIARLRDPGQRERLRVELEETGSDGFHELPVDWSTVIVDGESIADLAARNGARPIDIYCERCADSRLSASALVLMGNEENVRAIMAHPRHTAGSDGILVGERPHPRGWGTFARYLGVYVRELGVLGLSECVRQMTSLSARRLGLADRGLIRPGMAADLAVFDFEAVRDVATYEQPRRLAEGFEHVVVNGELVLDARRAHGRHARPRPAAHRCLNAAGSDPGECERRADAVERAQGREAVVVDVDAVDAARRGRSRALPRGSRPSCSPARQGAARPRAGRRRRARGRRRGRARRARGRRRKRSRRWQRRRARTRPRRRPAARRSTAPRALRPPRGVALDGTGGIEQLEVARRARRPPRPPRRRAR